MSNSNQSSKTPKVSVLMITYNHEKYIEQAVRSVMMQETDFEYELVIGEDCSTDSTRIILQNLMSEYSDTGKIKLLLNERNLGVGANIRHTYESCNGEYVAFIEGDDYWAATHKLKTQVELLSARPDVSLCFHPVSVWSESEQRIVGLYSTGTPNTIYDFTDLVNSVIYPHTVSVVVRKSSLEIPPIIDEFVNVDLILYFICAEQGKLAFVDEQMAVYRQHSGGVWSEADVITKRLNSNKTYLYLNERYQYRYARHFRLRERMLALSREYSYCGQLTKARRAALDAIFNRYGRYLNLSDYAKTLLLAFVPHTPHLVSIAHKRLRARKMDDCYASN